MAVDDLWFLTKKDPETKKWLPSKRNGRGKRWRVRYIDDTGSPRERLFDRKPDAVVFDSQVRTDVSRGLYIDPAEGRRKLSDYATSWQAARLGRDSTAELVKRSFDLHIEPVLGDKALASVRPTHVQAFVKHLSDSELAPGTVRLIYSHLAVMFKAAVQDRAVAISPCRGVKLPEVDQSERSILSTEQVHAVAEALRQDFRACVFVCAGLGLRPGEMLGLELGHVNFLRREVEVVQQLCTATGRSPFIAPLKTKASRRVVELPAFVAEELARHIKRHPPAEVMIGDETSHKKTDRGAQLLFTDGGTSISRSMWSKAWAPAARVAKLPPRTGAHALRHYYASLLIGGGADVKTVQLALGHASPVITLETYVSLWPGQLDRTRNLVDAALNARTSPRSRVGAR